MIFIGDDISIEIVHLERGQVRLGIIAPQEIKILRGELMNTNHAKDSKASDQQLHQEGKAG
jgi:carbon storage regulator CsrA